MKQVIPLCAEFSRCANEQCTKNPHPEHIDAVRSGTVVAQWGDYHIPSFGIKCSNYKEPVMGSTPDVTDIQ